MNNNWQKEWLEALNYEDMEWIRHCQEELAYLDKLKERQPQNKATIEEIINLTLKDIKLTNQAIEEKKTFLYFMERGQNSAKKLA